MLCLKPILCNHGEKEERMSYLNKKYLATTLLLQIVDFFFYKDHRLFSSN